MPLKLGFFKCLLRTTEIPIYKAFFSLYEFYIIPAKLFYHKYTIFPNFEVNVIKIPFFLSLSISIIKKSKVFFYKCMFGRHSSEKLGLVKNLFCFELAQY